MPSDASSNAPAVSDAVDALVTRLRDRLAAAEDPERAPQMQRYMKSTLPFRGVSMTPVRRIAAEAVAAHPLPDRPSWERAVRRLWEEAAYREERYAALTVAGHRRYRSYQDPGTLPLYRHLVSTGAWWDLVDDIATHRVGDILRGAPDQVAPVLRAWAADDDMWVRRAAVLAQLGSRTATDVDLLRLVLEQNLLDSRHGSEFFVRKAVGWALREYAKTDPAWVLDFVDRHADRLSPLSRREALKHVTA